MTAPIDIAGILDRAGANADAPEGSQAWALAQVAATVGELVIRTRALQSAHVAFQEWKAKAVKTEPAPRSLLEMNVHAKAMLFAAAARISGQP